MAEYEDDDDHQYADGNQGDDQGSGVDSSAFGEAALTERPKYELITHFHDLDPTQDITHVAVQNDVMALIGGTQVIVRDMSSADEPYRTTLPSPGVKVFIDSSGLHVFASTQGNDLFYINPRLKVKQRITIAAPPATGAAAVAGGLLPINVGPLGLNPSSSTTFSGSVTCIGWDRDHVAENTTGNLLLGTKAGQLLEARVDIDARGQVGTQCTVLTELNAGLSVELTAIELERIRVPMNAIVAIVCSTSSMFRFVGATFRAMFDPIAKQGLTPSPYAQYPQSQAADANMRGSLTVYRPTPSCPAQSYLWAHTLGLRHGLFEKADGALSSTRSGSDGFDACDADDDQPSTATASRFRTGTVLSPALQNDVLTSLFSNEQRILMSRKATATGLGASSSNAAASSGSGGGAAAAATAAQIAQYPFDRPPIDATLTAFHMICIWDDRIIVLGHPAGMQWMPKAAAGSGGTVRGLDAVISTSATGTAAGGGSNAGGAAAASAEVRDIDLIDRVRFDPFKGRRIGRLRGLVRDINRRHVFVYNDRNIWQIDISGEHKGQWRLFLTEASFNDTVPNEIRARYFKAALALAGRHKRVRDAVTYAMGKFYLRQMDNVDFATTVFSRCRLFENVYLMLLDYDRAKSGSGKRTALALFVEKRLTYLLRVGGRSAAVVAGSRQLQPPAAIQNAKAKGASPTQLACLVALFIELKLGSLSADLRDEIARLNSTLQNQTRSAAVSPHLQAQAAVAKQRAEAFARIRDPKERELAVALKGFSTRMHDEFTDAPYYQLLSRLLSSHGCINTMLSFAEAMQRNDFAIAYHLNRSQFKDACAVLISKCRPTTSDGYGEAGGSDAAQRDGNLKLWYKYAPTLIQRCPNQLITGLLKLRVRVADGLFDPVVNPELLIPAFVGYDPAMNRLEDKEFQLKGDLDEHLVIFYLRDLIDSCGYSNSEPVNHLLLTLMLDTNDDALEDFIERLASRRPEYALRQCLGRKRYQLCVPLYQRLGLLEDAVTMALDFDIDKAKQIAAAAAGDPSIDRSTLKRIWLLVARHIVKKNAKAGLKVIDESKGVLRLEDVIGNLDKNDTWVISEFKEAICASLDAHAETIQTLKREMAEAQETAKLIKEQERAMQYQYGYVTTTQKCPLCPAPILRGRDSAGFVVYPACRHAFHDHCLAELVRSQTDKRKRDISTALGLPPPGHPTYHEEDVYDAECPVCGELTILQTGDPFVIDGDSWKFRRSGTN